MARSLRQVFSGGGQLKNKSCLNAKGALPRKRGFKPLAVVAAGALALTVGLGTAQAAGANPFESLAAALGIEPAAATRTIEGLTPKGFTVNMFDYWLTSQDESYRGNTQASTNAKINNGHQLYFTSKSIGITNNRNQQVLDEGSGSASNKNINSWTGSSASNAGGPRTGIVENKLGDDGYPVLASGSKYSSNASGRTWSTTTEESLGYLFNTDESDGKAVYKNVTGLFQLNDQGSYYYDSTKNFASLVNADGDIGTDFTLYEKPAVNADSNVADRSNGQFFPFNSADEVFTDSTYQTSNITSSDSSLNHFFGMHASATFMQPEDGKVAGGGDMVFDFSGDDDVWVFIDGVLVGDVSGMHDALQLTINFATGDVVVKNAAKNANQTSTGDRIFSTSSTTIADAFKAAGVTSNAIKGKTFKSGTYHKLDFFYLERGGGNSNMKLTSNLASIPETEVTKVDQNGAAVPGASFKLYAADENGNANKNNLIGEGTTDHNGKISFTSNGVPVNFTDLANTDHITNYVLEETFVPNDYRTSSTTSWLQYVTGASGTGFLVSMDPWKSGTWAAPREKLTINDPEKLQDAANASETHNLSDGGTVYAIVMKRIDTSIRLDAPENASNWKAVKGDPLNGWKLSDAAITDADDLNKLDGSFKKNVFEKDGDGRYVCTFSELPGDPRDYYFFSKGDTADRKVQYSIAYYYEGEDGQPHRLNDEQFSRQYAANLFVGNMQNRLLVQKVDDAGNAVDGAVFGLYTEDQTKVVDGKRVLQDGAKPTLISGETQTLTQEKNGIDLEGGAIFSGLNTDTTYYLGEVSVPAGYVKNTVLTEVRVDEAGVHANAGVKDDGIETLVGAGAVVKSVAQFGTSSSVDSTLHDIKISKLAGTQADDGTLTWGADKEDSTVKYLTYDTNDAALEYGPAAGSKDQSVVFTSDIGWADVKVEQNYGDKPGGVICAGEASKVDIAKSNHSSANVSGLFTGSTIVRVTNERVAKLEVTKKVEADASLSPDPNAGFTFKFTFPDDKEYDAQVFDAEGNPVGDSFKLSNADHNEQTIKVGETIRVYGLETGKKVTVEELDSDGKMPAGFTFTKSSDAAHPDTDKGKSVTVTIADPTETVAAPANRLEFTNTYDVSDLTNAPSFAAEKKLLEKTGGSDTTADKVWTDIDKYTMRLTVSRENGYVMPNGTAAVLEETDVPLPSGFKSMKWEDETEYYFDGAIDKDTQPEKKLTVDDLVYKKPGTYTFYFYEVTPEQDKQVPGTKYSNALYKVVVSVKDSGTGKMYVQSIEMTCVENDDGDELNNQLVSKVTYSPDGKVESTDPANSELLGTVTNVFTHDSFNASMNGYKDYDNMTKGPDFNTVMGKFTYTVRPVSDNDDTNDLSNMPTPTGRVGQLTGDAATWTASVTANHQIAFGELSFENPTDVGHTYVYQVTENIPGDATNANVNGGKTKYSEVTDPAQKQQAGWKLDGITYDSSVYEVTYVIGWNDTSKEVTADVTWTKDGEDYPLPSATLPSGDINPAAGRIVFTNSYAAEPVTQDLSITKTLKGRDWTAGETFSFTLSDDSNKDKSGYTLPANGKLSITQGEKDKDSNTVGTKDKAYTFDYGTITFTKAGTYKFTIEEQEGDKKDKGLKYDDRDVTVTVTVEDNGKGTLTAKAPVYTNSAAGENATSAAFVNTYTAKGSYTTGVTVTKQLESNTGKTLKAGDFTFTIEGVDQPSKDLIAGDAFENDRKFSNSEPADGIATMEKLKDLAFTQDQAGNTYTFIIKEAVGTDGERGLTYDKSEYRLTLTVVDNVNGTLTVEDKLVQIKGKTGNTIANPTEANSKAAAFTNTYTAEAENGTALLSKELKGRDWQDGDSFTFHMEKYSYKADAKAEEKFDDEALKKLPEPSANVEVTNETAGYQGGTGTDRNPAIKEVRFDEMTFVTPGVYTYKVTELGPDGKTAVSESNKLKDGVTYDGAEITVTFTVTDLGYGHLNVAVAYSPDADGVTKAHFTNTYAATGDSTGVEPQVIKAISGEGADEAYAKTFPNGFEFKLTFAGDDAQRAHVFVKDGDRKTAFPKDGITKRTDKRLTEANNQSLTFGNLVFDAEDEYTFQIAETNKSGSGWTTDTTPKTVTVKVDDNNKGGYTATLAYAGADANAVPTVTNTYVVDPATEALSLAFKGTKTMTGRDFQAGDAFTFTVAGTVTDANGDTKDLAEAQLPNGGSVTIEPTKDKSVEIKFGSLKYSAVDLNKTFTYTFTEQKPTDDTKGVTYNVGNKTYTVTVKVVDNNQGGIALEVNADKATYADGTVSGIDFENAYAPKGQSNTVTPQIVKKITGTGADAAYQAMLKANKTFSFELTADANDEATAKAIKAGAIKYLDENDKAQTFEEDTKLAVNSSDKLATSKPDTLKFSDLVFTQEGTFKFKIVETNENENGWTGVNKEHEFTVTVSDNLQGGFKAAIEDNAEDTVTNTYAVKADATAEATPAVTKTVKGHASNSDVKFTLELTKGDAKHVEGLSDDNKTITIDGAQGELKPGADPVRAAFGTLTFDAEGTYEFTVTESNADELAKLGWTSAPADGAKITFTVSDNNQGGYKVTSDPEDATVAFTNTYGISGDGVLNLSGMKYMDGREFAADDAFSFQIKGTDEDGKVAPLPEGKDVTVKDGVATLTITPKAGTTEADIVWPAIKFASTDAGKTFTYTVNEVAGADDNGITYDTAEYTVVVKVDDDGQGGLTLDTTVTKRDASSALRSAGKTTTVDETGLSFTNVYGTGAGAKVDTNALFSKKLTGRDWFDGDTFTFALKAETENAPLPQKDGKDNTTATVTNKGGKDGSKVDFGFGTITFTDKDMKGAKKNEDGKLEKQFVYQVTEENGGKTIDGVTYDGRVATLTITVIDDGKGTLSASSAVSTVENGAFENVYSTSTEYRLDALVNVTKKMTGRDMTAGQFSFTLAAADSASAKKLGVSTDGIKGVNDAASDGEVAGVTFADLANRKVTFSNKDNGKTYTLKIAENGENGNGYTLDTLNKGEATVTFAPTYDAATGKLTVEVTATKGGKQIATATLDGAEAKAATVAFENEYAAAPSTLGGEGEVAIKATKKLANKPLEGNDFTFNVVNKLDKSENAAAVTTGTNDAEGAITFKGITYTTEQLEADAAAKLNNRTKNADGSYTYEYQYTVSEATPASDSGVTVENGSFDVTVTVTDAGKGGKLDIKVGYPEGSNGSLAFANTYGADQDASLAIKGSKVLAVKSGDNAPSLEDIAGKYTFKLTSSEGAPMPEQTTASNDAAGNVTFGKIVYTMEGVFGDTGSKAVATDEGDEPAAAETRTKTFTYTVTESGTVAGITNDAKASKTFTVTVTDNGGGTLTATSDPAEGAQFSFTNTYGVDPEPLDPTGENGISVSKKLTGRDMAAGEFAFELVNADDEVVATGTSAAAKDGETAPVKLTAAKGFETFTAPGYYVYTLREVTPSAGEPTKGVSYDTSAYKVVATVVDDGKGELEVTWSCGNDGKLLFENSYKAAPTSVVLGASKVLAGRDMAAKEFSFQITDGSGNVVAKGTNAAAKNGVSAQVTGFDALPLNEEGTYKLTTAEVLPEDDDPATDGVQKDGVTYDESTFTTTLTVVDDGEGQLVIDQEQSSIATAVFKNTYTAPEEPVTPVEPSKPGKPDAQEPDIEKPEDKLPTTGDQQLPAAALGVIALAGAALVGTGVVLEKRRK